MRYKLSTIFTVMCVLLLLGNTHGQSEDSLIYFSTELEVGYDYIWESSTYIAPTFLEEEIRLEGNITIEILKEIDNKDINALDEEQENFFIRKVLDYFLITYSGIAQTKELIMDQIEARNSSINLITIGVISQYILPVVVVASNGETSNQFDTLAENFLVIPDEEYAIDGDVVTYKLDTGGDVVSKYIEKQFEYSTGLLLYSNVSNYGENGLISQYITTLKNNIEAKIETETRTIQTPTNATEIGFLPFPSTWVSIIGIIAVFAINKQKIIF
ncbi:MAG: hypothetical protein GPJ54_12650 [Candidatus Heimdallarchaeota archaeon]|nr:hypothetical protein [Candidatus Heimdallarchaeota archaeon]